MSSHHQLEIHAGMDQGGGILLLGPGEIPNCTTSQQLAIRGNSMAPQ